MSDPHTPASNASFFSERAAQIEAAALDLAAQLADKQQELNRRRREAALAAKAALVDQMKASIAEIDSEIQVCILACGGTNTSGAALCSRVSVGCLCLSICSV